MTGTGISGCRVLVAEDEALVGIVLEDMLDMLGCVIAANCATLGEAQAACDDAFDFAIIDVNLGDEPVYPLADVLLARGIPFAFATGAVPDSLPSRFAGCPVLEKPYAYAAVEAVVVQLAAARKVATPAG